MDSAPPSSNPNGAVRLVVALYSVPNNSGPPEAADALHEPR